MISNQVNLSYTIEKTPYINDDRTWRQTFTAPKGKPDTKWWTITADCPRGTLLLVMRSGHVPDLFWCTIAHNDLSVISQEQCCLSQPVVGYNRQHLLWWKSRSATTSGQWNLPLFSVTDKHPELWWWCVYCSWLSAATETQTVKFPMARVHTWDVMLFVWDQSNGTYQTQWKKTPYI